MGDRGMIGEGMGVTGGSRGVRQLRTNKKCHETGMRREGVHERCDRATQTHYWKAIMQEGGVMPVAVVWKAGVRV